MERLLDHHGEASAQVVAKSECTVSSARGINMCVGNSEAQADDFIIRSARSKFIYRPGDKICDEGERAEQIFCMSQGAVRVFKLMPDGRRQITGFLFGGDFLGLSLLGRYVYSAEAMTSASACVFDREFFEQLCLANSDFERRLREYSSYQLALAHDQMLTLGRKTARERVASFLLQLSHRAEQRGHDALQLSLPMKRYEIADYLGLTFETVSRQLRDLERENLIRMRANKAVTISKLEALRSVAGYDRNE